MVNGRLVCLGSPQELKSKYGQGYKLKIRLGQAERSALISVINDSFPSALIEEEHLNSIICRLPPELKLSQVFEKMEMIRSNIDIDDYSLSQTTLDDVFIYFVSDQRSDEPDGGDLEGDIIIPNSYQMEGTRNNATSPAPNETLL
jgi:ABC-type multidrug transport system ATPase subunit